MAVRVDEIDARTASDEVLAQFAAVEHGTWHEHAPGEPLRTTVEVIAFYRHQPTSHTSCHWLAEGGLAGMYVHGPSATFFDIHVVPARRRKGVGAALLECVLDRARELDVRSLHGHHSTPAGAAFAARFGFTDGQRVVRSLLQLPDADLPEPVLPDGWRLETWLGRVPDVHLAAFVTARAAMDDAPTSDNMEFPAWTAAHVRASEDSLALRNREMRVTVAIRADGEIGAFTELRVSRGSTLGFTDDTGTLAVHRGQGLARAVKLESLRRLRDDHPELTVVSTSNAEENTAMRHVNDRVGFRPSAVETTATLNLSNS
ncbi:MAG TPA: GNAT family N-acetyltransferase [Gaiellaceae bacterium]|nr:GNAT family N-acetyltransferase [Gaiellaceae bacterium]